MYTHYVAFRSSLALIVVLVVMIIPALSLAQTPAGAQQGLIYQKGNPKCKVLSVTVQIQNGAPAISNPVPNPDPEAKDPCYSSATYVGLDGKAQALPSELEKALSGAATAASQGFFSQLGQQLASKLMEALMGGGGAPSGGAPTSGSGSFTPTQQPNTVDQINNAFDSGQLNTPGGTGSESPLESTYEQLLKNLFGRDPVIEEAATKGSSDNTQTGSDSGDTGTGASTIDGTDQGSTTSSNRPAGLGSIRADGTGGVLVVDVSNENTGIVGFFGSPTGNTFGDGTSSSPIGRLCSAQPWKGSFVSYVIPDRFFDGLCTRLGYTPGAALAGGDGAPIDTTQQEQSVVGQNVIRSAQPSAPTRGITCEPGVIDTGDSAEIAWSCGRANLAQVAGFRPNSTGDPSIVTPTQSSNYGILCDDGVVSQCSITVVNPQLTIWSEPEEIVLGTRATIFWYAEDVASCSVDGPSFHETGVQGGASTVPITEATQFTMTCQSLSGATTTKSFIVDLAL